MQINLHLHGVRVELEAPASILDSAHIQGDSGDNQIRIYIPEQPVPEPIVVAAPPDTRFKVVLTRTGTSSSGWNKIMAIKYTREALGCGLKEAKDKMEDVPSVIHTFDSLEAAEALRADLASTGDINVAVLPASAIFDPKALPLVPPPVKHVFEVRDTRFTGNDVAFRKLYNSEAEAIAVFDFFNELHRSGQIADSFYSDHAFFDASVRELGKDETIRFLG